jgi:phosphatidate cytidylyltransferase
MSEFFPILTGIGGLLLFADAIEKRVRNVPDLQPRIRSWWAIVIILASAYVAGRGATIAVFGIISFLALREFLTVSPVTPVDHAVVAVSFYVLLPAQYVLIAVGNSLAFMCFIPVFAFAGIPVMSALSGDPRNFTARVSEHAWALMVCVYGLSYVPALLMLGRPQLIVFLVVLAQANDVLQYVFGKLLGRHALARAISPAKTIEGAIGGIAGTILLGAGLWWITPFSPASAAAMGLIIAITGSAGGLVLSAIKRDRGIKDWSALIPGHGGVLDRADSLWLSAPVFFHLARMWFTS